MRETASEPGQNPHKMQRAACSLRRELRFSPQTRVCNLGHGSELLMREAHEETKGDRPDETKAEYTSTIREEDKVGTRKDGDAARARTADILLGFATRGARRTHGLHDQKEALTDSPREDNSLLHRWRSSLVRPVSIEEAC